MKPQKRVKIISSDGQSLRRITRAMSKQLSLEEEEDQSINQTNNLKKKIFRMKSGSILFSSQESNESKFPGLKKEEKRILETKKTQRKNDNNIIAQESIKSKPVQQRSNHAISPKLTSHKKEDQNFKAQKLCGSKESDSTCLGYMRDSSLFFKLRIKKEEPKLFLNDSSCSSDLNSSQESIFSLENSFDECLPSAKKTKQIKKGKIMAVLQDEFSKRPKNSLIIRKKKEQACPFEKIRHISQSGSANSPAKTFEFICYQDKELYSSTQFLSKIQDISADDDLMTDEETMEYFSKICYSDLIEGIYRQQGIINTDLSQSPMWRYFPHIEEIE